MVEVGAGGRTGYYGYSSGVSWAAVAAGALASLALTLVLLTLGTGIGLSAVSPWPGQGVEPSEATLSIATGGYLVLTSLIASAVGGYLAGRLGSSWTGLHTDEIYFRDTAHGFLAWALATVVGAYFLAAAATAVASGAAEGNTAALGASNSNQIAAITDRLSRPGTASTSSDTTATINSSRASDQQVAQAAPVAREDRPAAEAARRTAVHTTLWSVAAMLLGAFAASLAATWGAPHRSRYVA